MKKQCTYFVTLNQKIKKSQNVVRRERFQKHCQKCNSEHGGNADVAKILAALLIFFQNEYVNMAIVVGVTSIE